MSGFQKCGESPKIINAHLEPLQCEYFLEEEKKLHTFHYTIFLNDP
jgi:hypothetical protein